MIILTIKLKIMKNLLKTLDQLTKNISTPLLIADLIIREETETEENGISDGRLYPMCCLSDSGISEKFPQIKSQLEFMFDWGGNLGPDGEYVYWCESYDEKFDNIFKFSEDLWKLINTVSSEAEFREFILCEYFELILKVDDSDIIEGGQSSVKTCEEDRYDDAGYTFWMKKFSLKESSLHREDFEGSSLESDVLNYQKNIF